MRNKANGVPLEQDFTAEKEKELKAAFHKMTMVKAEYTGRVQRREKKIEALKEAMTVAVSLQDSPSLSLILALALTPTHYTRRGAYSIFSVLFAAAFSNCLCRLLFSRS